MDDFEIEIKIEFLREANDLLQNAEHSFLELEKNPSDKSLIDTIFRCAHNLKGTSRAVGFGEIAELTHSAENLLLEIKQDNLNADAKIVSLLLAFSDMVRTMVDGLSQNLNATFDCKDLVKQLGNAAKKNSDESFAEVPENISQEIESDEVTVAKIIPVSTKKEIKKEARKDDETLRVSLNRLERLNDLVGELVILQTLVESSLTKVGEVKTSRSLGKLCKDIQDLSMSLRMVPVGPTFQKLSRIVRDTSKILGKKINLQLMGEETEIDKTVIESLSDPLVHIIRNAIDHGVESPEDRINAGKSEDGMVEVMAFHEGNFLIIQITDDGKGINPDILYKKAISKGIISPNSNLTDQQKIELIFHPGFSTKEEVSEVSGRGVGMDVVRTNIEELGGEVKVRSRVGSGSCFRLMLPLTLAIIEGMLIESGGQSFIIPKSQVQEVTRIEECDVTSITGRVPYFKLRDQVIPLFNFEEDLGLKNVSVPQIALIVRHGEKTFAVGISDVVRLQQVVVKPSTREMTGRAGVMGITILGDGKPSVIIDLLSLYIKRVFKETSIEHKTAS